MRRWYYQAEVSKGAEYSYVPSHPWAIGPVLATGHLNEDRLHCGRQ